MDDISLQTGLPAQSTLYSAHETLRALDAALGPDGGDGALLQLPHSCGVQLETLRLDNQPRRCGWWVVGGLLLLLLQGSLAGNAAADASGLARH